MRPWDSRAVNGPDRNQGAPLPQRRPTLEDVAARAGVSRALVSIVMRDVPGASDATRARVRQVADEMGYRPDARARLLAGRNTPLLGAVFANFGAFHLQILDGLYAAAERAGCDLILSALTAHRDERRAVETLLDFRCDAAILLGPESTGAPVLAGKLPVVVVGWDIKDPAVDVVRTSDSAGSRLVMDHLHELGHRRIAHVDGGRGSVAAARRRGYRDGMRRHGLGEFVQVLAGGWNQHEGATAARRLLTGPVLPTAVVAFNDEVAAGATETLRQAGLRVPEDVSVVGWDDSPTAALPHLNLTTIRQDGDIMAELAVGRCVARMSGADVTDREIVLPPELITRTSAGRAPAPASRSIRAI